MTIVDNIVDVISSRLIRNYTYDLKNDTKSLTKAYAENKPVITELYSQAFYWHGTGRYHYKHEGESKYHSKFTDDLFDVLSSIIDHNGLIPQYDFWTKIASISLTKNRIYARAYSEFHQYESKPLTYTYGSTFFWFCILATKQIFTNSLFYNLRRMRKMHKNKDFKYDFQQWARYVRKNTFDPVIHMMNFYKLKSDIPNNYGILFGIRKEAVEEVTYDSTVERFEARCLKPISFDQMTHLEVPLKNLEETKQLLKSKGINLQVLPLEITEIYCSELGYDYFSK